VRNLLPSVLSCCCRCRQTVQWVYVAIFWCRECCIFCCLFRYSYTVTLQLTESLYSSLPRGLFAGRTVHITPVMFTIGINEQATFAEKYACILCY